MLIKLFPRSFKEYQSLPVLGSFVDDFDSYLKDEGYTRNARRVMVQILRRVDQYFCSRGIRSVHRLRRENLDSCYQFFHLCVPNRAGTVRVLERFLSSRGFIRTDSPVETTRTSRLLAAYELFLKDVRGFAPSTVNSHRLTTGEFLSFIDYEDSPNRLEVLSIEDIEGFLIAVGRRLSRGTMQHVVAALRAFLRYLVLQETIDPGLENQIETPRHYRFEQLPRSLPWKTVLAFLQSIDLRIPMGIRDYSMFILMTTYGLRACEVVSLTIDDIEWRTRQLRIPQQKTGNLLVLPLTDEVATALVDYLKKVRPVSSLRQVFLRVRAPIGILKPTAVIEAFQRWSKLSGLSIPFQGAHCLRHSYAVYMLQRGTPLKTIGDLLGHRDAESTCVYLRLHNDELRQVVVPVPDSTLQKKEQPS